MQPTCSYLVCATPRSGSTLLCEALTNTGLAGHPKEFFEALRATGLPRRPQEYFTGVDDPEISAILGDFSRLDDAPIALQGAEYYADYLAHVLEDGTTPNGVFGAKVMWGYFGDFTDNLRDIPAYKELPTPDLLARIFPDLRYIHVSRNNRVRQAISLWKAIQTWTWREDESFTSTGEPAHQKRELHFHFGAVDYLVQRIEEHERAWDQFFTEAAVQPFRVNYEDLSANYEQTALSILDYLGIPIPEQIMFAERRMKRQADTLSEQWYECYYAIKQAEAQADQVL